MAVGDERRSRGTGGGEAGREEEREGVGEVARVETGEEGVGIGREERTGEAGVDPLLREESGGEGEPDVAMGRADGRALRKP